ncbi:MAG: hypothetical protein U9Q61_04445 [Thermodesulfobacteriota bacterium]|nr:hypothetical protein [Thermodesulfobacteriota bacterium]
MNKPAVIRTLDNGVVVEFFDQSNRYYGDFYRVKINAVATIPLIKTALPEDLDDLVATCPDYVTYAKSLERMGVVSSDLQKVTNSLVEDFIESVGGYLVKGSFAENLLRKNMLDSSI